MKTQKKACYGILDEVFPQGKSGLREIVPECFQCPERTPCLRKAMETREGLDMRSGILERAEARGMIGRLRRWSQKKELSRQIKEQNKKCS